MANTTTTTTTPVSAGPAGPFGFLGTLVPFFLVIVAAYFLLIRPVQKREAKKRATIDSLKKGDQVVTAGGIIGSVHKIMKNGEILLEVAEGVRLKVLKMSVSDVLAKSSEENDENDDAEIVPSANNSPKRNVIKNASKKESAGKSSVVVQK
ncbi:MAG: preprotein translocase subunit YajC [Holosporaceae bacterium]|jgi:preprotein translocase subunit YajC|nr:preprotein translocase subunit YajC [Holosporaceae bacterium]